jgi:hypothetical protein
MPSKKRKYTTPYNSHSHAIYENYIILIASPLLIFFQFDSNKIIELLEN